MNETLNKDELNRLAKMGSEDGNEAAPTSIFTSIAASIMYCSNVSALTLATVGLSLTIF